MEPICSFCNSQKSSPIDADDKKIPDSIFMIKSDLELNWCQKCRKKLKEFHRFYVMAQENLAKLQEVEVKVVEQVVEVEIKTEDDDEDLFEDELKVEEVAESDEREACSKCGKLLKKISMRKHLKRHEKPQPRKVKKDQIMTTKALLRLAPIKYTCDLCQKPFSGYRTMKEHILNVHLHIFKCICNICGMGLNNPDSLQKHILYIHQKTDKDKCKICGRLVKNLKQHMNATHDKKSSLICSYCGRNFVNKKSYARHVKLAHEGGRHSHKCSVCGKGYKGGTDLKEHMQTHLGGFLYNCEFCSYQVNYKRNLRAHVKKIHTKEWIAQRHEYLNSIYDVSMIPTDSNNPGIALPKIEGCTYAIGASS